MRARPQHRDLETRDIHLAIFGNETRPGSESAGVDTLQIDGRKHPGAPNPFAAAAQKMALVLRVRRGAASVIGRVSLGTEAHVRYAGEGRVIKKIQTDFHGPRIVAGLAKVIVCD